MLGAILAGGSLIGKLLGGAGKGAADERGNANDFMQRENARKSNDYSTEQSAVTQLLALLENATKDRADRAISSPVQRTRQSLLGSLIQNYQPPSVSGLPSSIKIPQMSGGLGNAINPAARAGGGELQKQALMALLTKSDVPKLPDTATAHLAKPDYGSYQKPGRFESIASIAGLLGAGAGGVSQLLGSRKPAAPPQDMGGY